jgi:hypothetical protein
MALKETVKSSLTEMERLMVKRSSMQDRVKLVDMIIARQANLREGGVDYTQRIMDRFTEDKVSRMAIGTSLSSLGAAARGWALTQGAKAPC